MSVHIDLHDLTEQHLQRALDTARRATNLRERSRYSAPCIIGTLLPEDNEIAGTTNDDEFVHRLMDWGIITCPDDQRQAVKSLQTAFDSLNLHDEFQVELFSNQVRQWFK